jgi:hypothetical protein
VPRKWHCPPLPRCPPARCISSPARFALLERLVAVEAACNDRLAVGADDHEAADIRLHLFGDHRRLVVERIVGIGRGVPAFLELGSSSFVVLVERFALAFERRDRLQQAVGFEPALPR